jgi:hypothetical protein
VRNQTVSQVVTKLVQFNQGTDDRLLVLCWNASDIEDQVPHLDDAQLRKFWNGLCNNKTVLDALSHAEKIVGGAIDEVVINIDN